MNTFNNIFVTHWKSVLALMVFIIVAGTTEKTLGQVFPEVNTEGQEEKKLTPQQQLQEDEKLAQYYYRNKDYKKAAQLFESLYKRKENQYYYTYYLNSLVAMQEYDEAEKLIKKQLRNRSNARTEVDLGYIYLKQEKVSKAEKYFRDIISKIPAQKNAYLVYAGAFMGKLLYDYAEEVYLQGREELKGQYMFHTELARIYEMTGNYEGMIDEYLGVLETDPSQLSYVQGRLQSMLGRETDGELSEALRQALLKRSQQSPENTYFSEMLLWHSLQMKDFDFALIQAKSLDRRLNEDGNRVYSLAFVCMNNKSWQTAIDAYTYVINKGEESPYYLDSKNGLLRARFNRLLSHPETSREELESLQEGYAEVLQRFGRSPASIILRRDYAHLLAYYLDDLDSAIVVLEESIQLPGAQPKDVAQCKIDLADIYLFLGEVWESTLLYSQVEKDFKNDPVGHLAKFKNARLSFYIGEFGWAKAQLDVLKAATTKLIANDAMELSLLITDNMDPDSTYTGLSLYSRAELLALRNFDSLALVTLDSIGMISLSHPLRDEVLFSKAKIFIKEGKYKLADTLLEQIVDQYSDDILADNALMKRAWLYEVIFNDPEKAMELYQQMLTQFPGSLFTVEARRKFRMLRGDHIDS